MDAWPRCQLALPGIAIFHLGHTMSASRIQRAAAGARFEVAAPRREQVPLNTNCAQRWLSLCVCVCVDIYKMSPPHGAVRNYFNGSNNSAEIQPMTAPLFAASYLFFFSLSLSSTATPEDQHTHIIQQPALIPSHHGAIVFRFVARAPQLLHESIFQTRKFQSSLFLWWVSRPTMKQKEIISLRFGVRGPPAGPRVLHYHFAPWIYVDSDNFSSRRESEKLLNSKPKLTL